MFEELINALTQPETTPEEDAAVDAITAPVQNADEPLSSSTASYANGLMKQTYGDDTEPLMTKEDLRQANEVASVRVANDANNMSLQRSLQKIVAGEYKAYDLQKEAFLNSLRIKQAEEDPSYGLAMENSQKLQEEALMDNPDMLVEPAEITADYNRTLTNRNILTQARKELVPVGLFENAIGSVMPAAYSFASSLTQDKSLDKSAADFTEGLTKFSLSNALTTFLGFFPWYDNSLRIRARKGEDGKVKGEWNPAFAELLHYSYWQNAIENDSNAKFKDRLSKYIKYQKDHGVTDGELDFMLMAAEDPSPKLASFGFAVDILASLNPLLKLTGKAAELFMKVFKGAPEGSANKVLKVVEGIAKDADEITEVDLRKALKEVGVITDPKTDTAVSFPKEFPIVGEAKTSDALKLTFESEDLTTPIGRVKAARNTKGTVKKVLEAAKASPKDEGLLRVLNDDYFDSAMKVAKSNKSVSHLDDVISEKDYQLLIGRSLNTIKEHDYLGRTQDELLRKAIKDLSDSLDAENTLYRSSGVSDILQTHYQDIMQKDAQGSLSAIVRVNKKFNTMEAAKEYANRLRSSNVDTYVMPTRNGKNTKDAWAVDAKIKLNKGFGTLMAEKHPGKYGNRFFSAVATTTSNPEYIRLLSSGRELEVAHLREFETSAKRAYNALKGEDKELFEALSDFAKQTGAFYTQGYLDAKGVSKPVKDALNAERLLNDIDYYLKNKSRHDDLIAGGFKYLKLGDKSLGYGKIRRVDSAYDELSKTPRRIIYENIDADPVPFGDLNLTKEAVDTKVGQGYVIVERTYGPDEFTDAASVLYFIPGHSLVENPIPSYVTNYLAGGRRYFSRSAGYVKQLVIKKGKSGRDVITGVQSFAMDEDAIGLAKKTAKIEQLRKAVVPMLKSGYVDEVAFAKKMSETQLTDVPFTNAEDFIKWAKSRGVDLVHEDNALVVAKDGDSLSTLNALKDTYDNAVSDDDMGLLLHRSAYQTYTQEAKMQKWMRTGKDLLAYNFKDTAKIVDFDKAAHYMLQDMVNSGVMSKFSDMYAEDFVRKFGGPEGVLKNTAGKTAKQILNSVRTWGDVDGLSSKAGQARIAAKNYRAIRGIPTDADAALANGFKELMSSIGEKIPTGFDELAHNIRVDAKAIEAMEPLRKVRWYSSAVMLGGITNLKQLITQMLPSLYTTLERPGSGLKALVRSFPMTMELWSAKGSYSKALDKYLSSLGDTPAYKKALWKALIDGRIFENTSYAGAFESVGSASKWESLERMHFVMKNWGELFNRVHSHITAYEELGFGEKGIQTAEDMLRWKNLGSTFFLNMDETGMSRIQTTGIMKTMTQFWSAMFRFWETGLFDKNLTWKDRVRLFGGIAALFGSRGLIGTELTQRSINTIKDVYNFFRPEDTGYEGLVSDATMSLAERAYTVGAVGLLTGKYDIGQVVTLPVDDMIKNVSDLFEHPIESVPSYSAVSQTLGQIKDLYDAAFIIRNSTNSSEGFKAALQTMVTSKNLFAFEKLPLTAYMLWSEGKRWSTRGELTIEDATVLDSVIASLGIPQMDVTDISALYLAEGHEKEKVEQVIKENLRLWNIYKDHPQAEGVYNLIMMNIDKAPLTDVQKIEVRKRLQSDTLYDTVWTGMQRKVIQQYKSQLKGIDAIKLNNLKRHLGEID